MVLVKKFTYEKVEFAPNADETSARTSADALPRCSPRKKGDFSLCSQIHV